MAERESTTVFLQAALDKFLAGDPKAKAELVNRAEKRLMILARKLLRGFGPGPDETAAIVSEAYLKLHTALDAVRPNTVRQFFGLASLQMRRVLLDLVRAAKRGGKKVSIDDPEGKIDVPVGENRNDGSDLVTDLYEAIDKLPDDLKEVVELLYLHGITPAEAGQLIGIPAEETVPLPTKVGMTQAEAGRQLGVHEDTVKRRWAKARVLLAGKLAAFDPEAE